jgi:hypothetical protein
MNDGIEPEQMNQKPTYKVAIEGERSTAAAMASLLLVSVVSVILEIRHVFLGQVAGASASMIVTALCCLVLAIRFREMPLKVALTLIGFQAAVRAFLSYAHASYALRHLAGVGGRALKIVGLLMLIFAIVKWFRPVVRRIPVPNPEGPTS